MKFYTSVLPYRGRLLVRGVNHDGSHKKYRVNYRPSLFVPANKESKYKTLDGRNAGKIDFDSIPDAKKWIDEYEDVSGFNPCNYNLCRNQRDSNARLYEC